MLFPLWPFIILGAVHISALCNIPSTKIIANYEFTEKQNGIDNPTRAYSTVNPGTRPPFVIRTPSTNWLAYSNGIRLDDESSPTQSNGKLDFSNLNDARTFSVELWWKCAKTGYQGKLLQVIDPTLGVLGCNGALFSVSQAGDFYSQLAIGMAGKDDASTCLLSQTGILPSAGRAPEKETHLVFTFNSTGANNYVSIKAYKNGLEMTGIVDKFDFVNFDQKKITPWAQTDLKLMGDAHGTIYKVAFYNEALDAADVQELYTSCRPNNRPYAFNFSQHVKEDELVNITLNLSPQPSEIIDFSVYTNPSYYSAIQKITGRTEVIDFDFDADKLNGLNPKYKFEIMQMPEKFSIFQTSGSDILQNQEYEAFSLTLQYQPLQNENSWKFSSNNNQWETNLAYTTFTYRVSDGFNWTDIAIVTIIVDPQPDKISSSSIPSSVSVGSNETFYISAEHVDQFVGVNDARFDAVITVCPTNLILKYCNQLDTSYCRDCGSWIDCQANQIINGLVVKNFLSPAKFPCIMMSALDTIGLTPDARIMAQDTFTYHLVYTDSNPLFVELKRTGDSVIANIDITNPLNPRGNAPFVDGECSIVEDENSTFSLDYTTGSLTFTNLTIKIKKRPKNFRGTLYIREQVLGDEDIVLKNPNEIFKYLSDPNDYTTFLVGDTPENGYSFDFSLNAIRNGEVFKSDGTQHLCVSSRNDKPVINQIKFTAPHECCDNNKPCKEEELISTIQPEEDFDQQMRFSECVAFIIDFSDPDENSTELYRVTLSNLGKNYDDAQSPLKFTLPAEALSFSFSIIDRVLLKTKNFNDEQEKINYITFQPSIIFEATYLNVIKILSLPGIGFKVGTTATFVDLNIEIEIREPRRKMQTKDEENYRISMTNSRIEISKQDKAGKEDEKLFGPFTSNTFFFFLVGCLAILCLCMCSVCVFCYKYQAKRIERKCERKLGIQKEIQHPASSSSQSVDISGSLSNAGHVDNKDKGSTGCFEYICRCKCCFKSPPPEKCNQMTVL